MISGPSYHTNTRTNAASIRTLITEGDCALIGPCEPPRLSTRSCNWENGFSNPPSLPPSLGHQASRGGGMCSLDCFPAPDFLLPVPSDRP
ncbi:hypothetical protein BRADI_2g55345v3 [Brachypodium distachyon]|uniref:Uncharacterized protein n=1 Tax=Brachypodium distachyon TaxID=15368 RepID=A0A2K2DG31_BRADI|nr:hypothetical protein BRADI_2g55345v3 [Brachypodium distachyon]